MNPRARRDWGGYIHDGDEVMRAAKVRNHLAEERARCKEVEAGWIAEAEKRKHCHPECVDGFCHRKYINSIITAKELS